MFQERIHFGFTRGTLKKWEKNDFAVSRSDGRETVSLTTLT